jgi:Ca-activated chloride channel homolog
MIEDEYQEVAADLFVALCCCTMPPNKFGGYEFHECGQNTEGVSIPHNLSQAPNLRQVMALVMALFFSINAYTQTAHKNLRQGDGAYKIKEYKAAEGHYRDAQAAERSYKGSFNLGNSVYMQQRYDEALEMYDNVGQRAADSDLRAKAYYNQGNAQMYKQDFEKAVEAYKNSLRNNPNDAETKKNLAFAKKMLEKKQQQQQKNQQNNQQQQQQNQDNKQNQQQQNQQQNQDNKNKQPQNKQNQPPQNNQNNQQQQNQQQNQDKNPQNPQPNKVNKDNIERQLQIMDDEDRKVQQRLKKGKGKPTHSSKDW